MNQRLHTTIDDSTAAHPDRPPGRVAFVQSCWHKDIGDQCRDSFLAEVARLGIARRDIDLFELPGGLEIPLQAQILAKSGRYAAIVAPGFLADGCIYRPESSGQTVMAPRL